MKGKFRFVVFAIIFIALLLAFLYGIKYAASVAAEIKAENYTCSFWSEKLATAAIWLFAALALLSAVGIVFGILRCKAVYVIFIVFFAVLLALSGYFGFEHLKSMPFHVTRESIYKLLIYIALIIVSIAGILVNAFSLAKKPKV